MEPIKIKSATLSSGPILKIGPRGDIHPVSVPRDAFVINGGDLLQRWTNDKCVSTVPRVKNLTSKPLQSIAFFTSPRNDAMIDNIPHVNGPPRYAGILAGEHVTLKIHRTQVEGGAKSTYSSSIALSAGNSHRCYCI